MEDNEPRRRKRRTGILAGALATGVLGVFAVGAAANGDGGDATTQGSAPASSFVQQERPDRDRDGRDCPRGERGEQQAPQGAAPDTDVAL
jgi:hypothetical protein